MTLKDRPDHNISPANPTLHVARQAGSYLLMEHRVVYRQSEAVILSKQQYSPLSEPEKPSPKQQYRRRLFTCPIAGCHRKFDRRQRLEKHVRTHQDRESDAVEQRSGFCKRCYQRRDHLTRDDYCLPCEKSLQHNELEMRNSGLALMTAINNGAIDRAQRLSTYFNKFCVYRTFHEGKAIRRMSVLPALMDMDFQNSSLLRTAIDTLTQAHFAQITKLPYVVYTAQSYYGMLLRMLSDAMLQANGTSDDGERFPYTDREVIVGLMILSLLTSFENPLSIPGRKDHFMIHYTGTRRYLEARGSKCLDPRSAMDNSIYMGLVTSSSLMEIAGIDQKYSVGFDNSEWKEKDPFTSTGTNFYSQKEEFLSLIKPLAGHLRLIDEILADPKVEFDHDLYNTMQQLRQRLAKFLPKDGDFPLADVVHDDQMLNFEIEEHCFIASSPTITQFHNYPDADMARDVLLSTMICLIVNCAIIRLQLCSQAPASVQDAEDMKSNMDQAYTQAITLCQGVWYQAALPSLAYAKFIVIFVGMAQMVFEEMGSEAVLEYGWSQACLLATKLRVERLRKSGVVTLCFAHELGPGMRERCRWRTPRASIVSIVDEDS